MEVINKAESETQVSEDNNVLQDASADETTDNTNTDAVEDKGKRKLIHYVNPLGIAFMVISLVLVIVVIVQGVSVRKLSGELDKERMIHAAVYSKYQRIKYAGPSERIDTYNYAYGDVAIPAIEGVPVSHYKNENFHTDDRGYKYYYQDGELCSYVGIDVSEHNGQIDWDKVKASGVDFVMLRIGGRGWGTEGIMYEDSMFIENLEGAKDAGLMVGAYFFSQAVSAEEATEEANFALSILGGRELDYPLAFDWETIDGNQGARTDNIAPDVLTDCAVAFCNRVKESGYVPCLYTGITLAYYKYDLGALSDIDIWYASYNDTPGLYYNFMMWQYASDGRVPGVSGDVDLNICFKNYK